MIRDVEELGKNMERSGERCGKAKALESGSTHTQFFLHSSLSFLLQSWLIFSDFSERSRGARIKVFFLHSFPLSTLINLAGKKSKVRHRFPALRSWVNPEIRQWTRGTFFLKDKKENNLSSSPFFPFGWKIINFCGKTGSPLPQRWQI